MSIAPRCTFLALAALHAAAAGLAPGAGRLLAQEPGSSPLAAESPVAARYEVRELDLPNGIRLSYATAGPAAGRPLILLHGYTDSWFSFSRLMPLLPEQRLIIPDLRGHGLSDRPDGGYGMDDMAEDVEALMAALEVRSAVIVGHSMGTFVAQELAQRAPDRVDGLVLIGGAASIRDRVDLDDFEAAVLALEDPVARQFVADFQASTVVEAPPPEFMETVVAVSLGVPAHVWREVMRGMRAAGPAAPGELTAPTLLVWGVEDGLMRRVDQEELVELIPGARMVALDGIGHAPHWEAPQRVAAMVKGFVAGVDASAP